MATAGPGKSKLTVPLIGALCVHLREGQPQRAAAGLVGIHRVTLIHWLNRGRQARSVRDEGVEVAQAELIYLRLLEEVELALDYGEGWLMQQAVQASQGKIKARATDFVMLLERTRPDQWRRRSSSEYVDRGKDAPARRVDVAKLDREEREQLSALLAKARSDDA